MKKFVPKYDRVLVIPIAQELESQGIILPESSTEEQKAGIVTAVGEGRMVDGKLVPLTTKPSDVVLFGQYAGLEIEIEGRLFIVMRDEEILGTLVEEKNEVNN